MRSLLFASIIAGLTLSPAAAQLFGNPDQASQAQQVEAQLNLRINQLEGQIRQLNGMIEQYESRIHKLEDQQKRFQDDVDFRFKDLEAAKGTGAGGAPAQPKKSAEVSTDTKPVQQPIVQQNPQVSDPNAAAALSAMAAKDKIITAPPSANPQDAYDLSYGYLLRGDYELAQIGFRDFLKNFPQDKNVSNAQYYLGEAAFARKNYKDAADAYLKTYQEHPQSAKASDALFRLGVALKALGAKNEACGTFAEFGKKYPRASNSLKNKVSAEQKATGC